MYLAVAFLKSDDIGEVSYDDFNTVFLALVIRADHTTEIPRHYSVVSLIIYSDLAKAGFALYFSFQSDFKSLNAAGQISFDKMRNSCRGSIFVISKNDKLVSNEFDNVLVLLQSCIYIVRFLTICNSYKNLLALDFKNIVPLLALDEIFRYHGSPFAR